ncbi:GGDEF domain-containing protein [Actinoplanes aureus]|uniref:GGDEF domain-containing protein n=1 Tax=Actinoplanes aureus TaxID=2792083 RepID=A0A931C705_9ACTN|nr:GGDEF domain-containing protein [Actinoplanes aureus]MBG0562547.1 GGDEF domain-containing protein [Actinoplanes aureus]
MDVMTRACLGLFAMAATWFAVNLVHPVGPPELLWITIPLYGPLVAAIFWSTARKPELPAPTRRFWRHLSAVPLLIGAGQTAQAVDVLTHPGSRASYTGPLMLVFDGVALLCLSYALSRLPVGGEQRGALARVVLDAGSVALAAAVYIWHFGTRQAIAAGVTPPVLASLALAVLAILAVFALAKAVLADYSAIDERGLRLLAAGVLIGALAPMLQPVVAAADERFYVGQVHLPAVFCLAALAARAQGRSPAAARGRAARKRRRPYSLLPYAAVAGVDGLLLWEAWTGGDDIVVVASCGVALTAVVVVRQISALRDNSRLLAQVNHAASHDALTGLANRALFQRRLTEALAGPGPVTVALLDLDGFKQVNDTFGHEAGDALLATVAGVLRECVRPGDTAARLGGDEFVLVLEGADRAEASRTAEAIADRLRRDRVRPIRASIGLACGVAGEDPVELLRRADAAMYAAKKIPGTAYQHTA